jgi:hypothetical protein
MVSLDKRSSPREPAVLLYQLVCLSGLGLILLSRVTRGVGLLDFLLAGVGLAGVLLCWRLAPLLVLFLLAFTELVQPYLWGMRAWTGMGRRMQTFDLNDVLVCCGVLAYVVGHYRLQGLRSHLLPPDPRRQPGEPPRSLLRRLWPPLVRRPRAPGLVAPGELAIFVLALPVWAVLAQLVWLWLSRQGSLFGLPLSASRFLVLVWALVLGGLIVSALLSAWRRRTMTSTEAALLLQDVLWSQTRGEQRRLQRWLAWDRLRRVAKRVRPALSKRCLWGGWG